MTVGTRTQIKGIAVFVASQVRSLIAVVFAFSLFATACGGGGTSASSNSDTSSSATTSPDSGTTDDARVDESADGSDAVTAADEAVEVAQGGTLRIGLQNEASSLNPTNTGINRGPTIIATGVFDTLVVVDSEGQWQDNLTNGWVPSEDFTSWDVTVREGVTFSDGEVMNADAVVANLEAFLADPLTSLAFKPAFAATNAVEKVDEMTFRLNASGPNTALPFYFTEQLGMIGSPAWLAARDDNPELDQIPIGAGPYKIVERVQDQITVLERNELYWGEPGILDRIELFPVVQDSTRTDQFLGGDLDVTHGTDAESILRLRDEGDEIQRIEDNSGEEFMLLMNAQVAPFDDIRVREAATAAFPKAQYDDFINEGTAHEADTLFSSETPWHDPSIEQVDDAPELAGPLIESYCADVPEQCTDGRVDIEFQHDGPSAVLTRVQQLTTDAWSPFFNATIDVIPNDQLIQQVVLGQYDVSTWRYHGFSDPDVDTAFLSCSTIGAFSINWSRNCNEERDALMQQQRMTTDQAERREIWSQIQTNLRDSFQYIVANHTNWTVAAGENVGGICDAVAPNGEELPCQVRGVVRLPQLFLTN